MGFQLSEFQPYTSAFTAVPLGPLVLRLSILTHPWAIFHISRHYICSSISFHRSFQGLAHSLYLINQSTITRKPVVCVDVWSVVSPTMEYPFVELKYHSYNMHSFISQILWSIYYMLDHVPDARNSAINKICKNSCSQDTF